MGIAALKKILGTQPFDPAELRGKTLAVDADNLIWSFVTALAAAEEPVPAPHLFGLVSRLTQYAKWGARSVWVFDGLQPDLKEGTLLARAARADAAKARVDAAKRTEVPMAPQPSGEDADAAHPRPAPTEGAPPPADRARQDAQAAVWVEEEQLEECRHLLSALGVPFIVAPGESDAQCADLVRRDHAWAAVTQDWDIALFGAPRALRNLTLSKTRAPELLDLESALAGAKLTRVELVDAAILIGTDYNEGVHGIGPVKAVALIRKHKTAERALEAMGVAMPTLARVRDIFLAHPVDADFAPRWTRPDEGATLKLLAEQGVAEKRGADLVAALREA